MVVTPEPRLESALSLSAAQPDVHREAAVGKGATRARDRLDLMVHRRGEDEQAVVRRLDLDRLLAAQVEHPQSSAGEASRLAMEIVDHRHPPPAARRVFIAG